MHASWDHGVGQYSDDWLSISTHTWWPWFWSNLMIHFEFQHMMAIVMVNDDHSADPRYETTKQQPNINQTTIKLLTVKQQPPQQTTTTTRTKATTTKNNSKLKCPSTCWPWPHVNNMSHQKKPCNTRSSVNIMKTRHCHSSSSCWPWCGPMTAIEQKTCHNL